MRLQLAALCLVALAGAVSAFLPPTSRLSRQAVAASSRAAAPRLVMSAAAGEELLNMAKKDYVSSLPEQAKNMQAEWQYMLVERMEPPTQTSGGLFLPSSEEDPLHVVRVVSFGEGQVGESGVLAPLRGLEVGDVAYTKQPWGIGPRDDIWEGRKFSFVRHNDVLARIQA